jgi:hypothetical protein
LAFVAAEGCLGRLGGGTVAGRAVGPGERAGEISLTLRAFGEDEPGDRMGEHLAALWPAFRRWWRESPNTCPTAHEARARLREW